MKRTEGQRKPDGKYYTHTEFYNEVSNMVKRMILKSINSTVCKKLFNKGFSVSDAVSYFIMNS